MAKEPPLSHKLGETQTEFHLDTAEENKNAAASLAQQARHSIDIFSQDLEAEIYNNQDFESSVIKLAKKHADTKIRILTQDSRKAVQNGHRLIKLAQSLTSSVFIHTPSRDYKDEKSAFLLVDKLGVLYRTYADDRNYRASVNFNSPQRAGQLTDFFNEAWEHSTPDIQTRRIYV